MVVRGKNKKQRKAGIADKGPSMATTPATTAADTGNSSTDATTSTIASTLPTSEDIGVIPANLFPTPEQISAATQFRSATTEIITRAAAAATKSNAFPLPPALPKGPKFKGKLAAKRRRAMTLATHSHPVTSQQCTHESIMSHQMLKVSRLLGKLFVSCFDATVQSLYELQQSKIRQTVLSKLILRIKSSKDDILTTAKAATDELPSLIEEACEADIMDLAVQVSTREVLEMLTDLAQHHGEDIVSTGGPCVCSFTKCCCCLDWLVDSFKECKLIPSQAAREPPHTELVQEYVNFPRGGNKAPKVEVMEIYQALATSLNEYILAYEPLQGTKASQVRRLMLTMDPLELYYQVLARELCTDCSAPGGKTDCDLEDRGQDPAIDPDLTQWHHSCGHSTWGPAVIKDGELQLYPGYFEAKEQLRDYFTSFKGKARAQTDGVPAPASDAWSSQSDLRDVTGARFRKTAARALHNHAVKKVSEAFFEDASRLWKHAIALDSKEACYQTNRASCLGRHRDFLSALQQCNDCISQYPKYAKAYFLRAIIRIVMKDEDGGERDFLKAVRLAAQSGHLMTFLPSLTNASADPMTLITELCASTTTLDLLKSDPTWTEEDPPVVASAGRFPRSTSDWSVSQGRSVSNASKAETGGTNSSKTKGGLLCWDTDFVSTYQEKVQVVLTREMRDAQAGPWPTLKTIRDILLWSAKKEDPRAESQAQPTEQGRQGDGSASNDATAATQGSPDNAAAATTATTALTTAPRKKNLRMAQTKPPTDPPTDPLPAVPQKAPAAEEGNAGAPEEQKAPPPPPTPEKLAEHRSKCIQWLDSFMFTIFYHLRMHDSLNDSMVPQEISRLKHILYQADACKKECLGGGAVNYPNLMIVLPPAPVAAGADESRDTWVAVTDESMEGAGGDGPVEVSEWSSSEGADSSATVTQLTEARRKQRELTAYEVLELYSEDSIGVASSSKLILNEAASLVSMPSSSTAEAETGASKSKAGGSKSAKKKMGSKAQGKQRQVDAEDASKAVAAGSSNGTATSAAPPVKEKSSTVGTALSTASTPVKKTSTAKAGVPQMGTFTVTVEGGGAPTGPMTVTLPLASTPGVQSESLSSGHVVLDKGQNLVTGPNGAVDMSPIVAGQVGTAADRILTAAASKKQKKVRASRKM